MSFKYLPHTDSEISEMLKVVGVDSLEALFAEIPESLRLKKEYDIPLSKSEMEVRRVFEELGKLNKPLTCFAGAGSYDHYTPAVIPAIVSRSEFLTSYTPYQAEISQGTLQYIFEYQTMMADLTGMEYANSSMYDGTTATMEAMFMALSVGKKKKKILMSSTVHPQVTQLMLTYAGFHGVEVIFLTHTEGQTDMSDLRDKLAGSDVAAVFMAQPNYYGVVEDFTGFAELCHEKKALFVMNCQASTLAVLKTPGEWGADIAVGDGQSLGIPLSFGGSYIGYLCAKKELLRKMPGRIVGGTVDAEGRRAFVLTFQAREQHIRREKATSNICTNQGLMSLFVTVYMSLFGPKGLREVNELSYQGAHYLHDRLLATGCFSEVFHAPFLNEFCLRSSLDVEALSKKFLENGILGGVKPQTKGMEDCLLFAVTEKRTKAEIDKLVNIVEAFKS